MAYAGTGSLRAYINHQPGYMNQKEILFAYEEYFSEEELNEADAFLLSKAKEATGYAYAPYSGFNVGAAARLANGEIVTGTNQENASYPAGLCAERVLLSSISSLHPKMPVESIAISYNSEIIKSDHPVAPCGICRQTLHEFETRMNQPIRLILGGMTGKVLVIANTTSLLPFAFGKEELG